MMTHLSFAGSRTLRHALRSKLRNAPFYLSSGYSNKRHVRTRLSTYSLERQTSAVAGIHRTWRIKTFRDHLQIKHRLCHHHHVSRACGGTTDFSRLQTKRRTTLGANVSLIAALNRIKREEWAPAHGALSRYGINQLRQATSG